MPSSSPGEQKTICISFGGELGEVYLRIVWVLPLSTSLEFKHYENCTWNRVSYSSICWMNINKERTYMDSAWCGTKQKKSTQFFLLLDSYWRRQWRPTPVLLPEKSHGQRSLVGCSPWGREESDMTEWIHFDFSLSCIGEGNGNPAWSCTDCVN